MGVVKLSGKSFPKYFSAVFCLAAGVASLAADSGKRIIVLKKGDVEISGCMKRSRVDPKVCFWGHKERPGCAGGCGEAVLPDSTSIEFGCSYHVSGTIVDSVSGKPREAFPIDLIFVGRSRFRGRTKEDGSFSIEVPARKNAKGCRKEKDFGRMIVEEDTPKVVLLGSLTPKFRAAHPKLKTTFKTADEFASEGVDTAR